MEKIKLSRKHGEAFARMRVLHDRNRATSPAMRQALDAFRQKNPALPVPVNHRLTAVQNPDRSPSWTT